MAQLSTQDFKDALHVAHKASEPDTVDELRHEALLLLQETLNAERETHHQRGLLPGPVFKQCRDLLNHIKSSPTSHSHSRVTPPPAQPEA